MAPPAAGMAPSPIAQRPLPSGPASLANTYPDTEMATEPDAGPALPPKESVGFAPSTETMPLDMAIIRAQGERQN